MPEVIFHCGRDTKSFSKSAILPETGQSLERAAKFIIFFSFFKLKNPHVKRLHIIFFASTKIDAEKKLIVPYMIKAVNGICSCANDSEISHLYACMHIFYERKITSFDWKLTSRWRYP